MKKHWLIFFILCASVHTLLFSAEKGGSSKENLALRRIAEYWKEGEFATVKSQIKSFLIEHPQSAYADSLNAMLGDLCFKEKNYVEALRAYDLICTEPFLQKTQFKHLYCLYEQKLFSDVVAFATAFLEEGKSSKVQESAARFQLADALFRLAEATDHPSGKGDLYAQALVHFKKLTETDYAEQILYPMAVIYSHSKDYPRAASLFKTLSAKYPDQKETFLFQAATLQFHFDKNASIDTFGEIYSLNGPHAPEAAYNQMQLLFEQKRYRDLLLVQEKALKHVPSEHVNTIRYYIGKSLFALNDYQHAVVPLSQFVESKPSDHQMLKSAYLSLVICAKEVKDMPLFDRFLKSLTTSFPTENETAQAILLHAQICKEKREFQCAQNDLKALIDQFPGHVDRETFLYEYALLFSLSHQWDDSVKAFKSFLSSYPASTSKANAYRHLIASQIEQTKSASLETIKIKKENLIETLVVALGEKSTLSPDEKKQLRFLLGKTMFEIGQVKDALAELEDYVRDFSNEPSCAEAHLLIAYCYARDLTQTKRFAEHAEKALVLGKNPPKNLRIQLYNAYLLIAQKAAPNEKSVLVDQAADHLFLALDQVVKSENRQWLANHYFQRYQACALEKKSFYLERTVVVLENILGLHGTTLDLVISPEKIEMESEAIKLSQLYAQAGRPSHGIGLLTALNRQYEAHPDLAWKYRRLTLFELGRIYEEIGDSVEAMRTYDSLISTSTHARSYFGTAARLKKSKLAYSLLSPEQKREASGSLQAICDNLKDLEIERRLVTEPWHLEAALTYMDIKMALAPENEKLTVESHLISQIRENFSSMTDPRVQQYLAAAEQFPEQFAVYEHYMQFLEAEELRLRGASDEELSADFLRQAEIRYDKLMQQPINELLKKRVQQRSQEIKKLSHVQVVR